MSIKDIVALNLKGNTRNPNWEAAFFLGETSSPKPVLCKHAGTWKLFLKMRPNSSPDEYFQAAYELGWENHAPHWYWFVCEGIWSTPRPDSYTSDNEFPTIQIVNLSSG